MPDPFVRERIENWAADFCGSDALRDFPQAAQEHAGVALTHFLCAACDARERPPGEIEESDAKAGLLSLAQLNLPPTVRDEIPALCGAFLTSLEAEGRLGGGRALGAFVRALRGAYLEAASGKLKPERRAGSRIGRNDPCPCGSGRKYKKCCMGE